MDRGRGFRGGHDGRERPFDWVTLARLYGIPAQQARALYNEAARRASAHREPHRYEEAIYVQLLKAARQQAWRPSPGKVTRTMRLEAERAGQRRGPHVSRLTGQPIAPGKRTLTAYLEAPMHGRRPGELPEHERVDTVSDELAGEELRTSGSPEYPGPPVHDHDWAVTDQAFTFDGIPSWPSWHDDPVGTVWDTPEHEDYEDTAEDQDDAGDALDQGTVQHLPESMLVRMERAFGRQFDDVTVHADSPEVPGGAQAFTRGREIHFRAGVYRPGTSRGGWLLAHELGHVVQQTAGRSASGGSRRALEAEADHAATLAMLGRPARIDLQAPHGMIQAFSDAEEHDEPKDSREAALAESDGASEGSDGTSSETPDAGVTPHGPHEASHDVEDATVGESEGDHGGEHEDESEGDPHAELDAIADEPVDASDAGSVAGGGSAGVQGAGAAPEQAAEDAPPAPQGPPEQAVAELQGVRPDLLAGALDNVHGSVSTDVEEARSAQAQDLPTMSSTGQEGGGAAATGAAEAGQDGHHEAQGGAEHQGRGGAGRASHGEGHGASGRESNGGAGREGAGREGAGREGARREGAGRESQADSGRVSGSAPERDQAQPGREADSARQDHADAEREPRSGFGRASGDSPRTNASPDQTGAGTRTASAPASGGQLQHGPGRLPGGPQVSVTALVEEVAASVRSWFSAWSGERVSEGRGPAMLQSDTARMTRSLDAVRTRDSNLRSNPGPAPVLNVQSQAQGDTRASRAELDQRVDQASAAARQETLQPAGEDAIVSTVPAETLAGHLGGDAETGGQGRAGADAPALPSSAGAAIGAAAGGQDRGAGGADAGAIGLIAQQERGAEIDAALTTARADMTAERQIHEQTKAQAKAAGRQEVATLSAQARADQAQARTDAQAQVGRARSDWHAEITQRSTTARAQAEVRVQQGLTDVAAEEQRGQAQAQQHLAEGQRRAESEKQKGEREAEAQKQRARGQSRGFLGWIADRASAFLDGVRRAVSSIIDAARRAVQRVVAEARRLASAVVERARRAVTGLIRRVGQALTTIGNGLLSRFRALRARFRQVIQGFFDRATRFVNDVSDRLKRGVQAVLDRVAQGIDAAFGLLARGLHAIVNGVKNLVQGAIQFAQGLAQSFGAFLGLIKDVASNPGGWLGKLGAAIMDGIRNHLWQALKTAVMGWFQSKVLELLGIGGVILQLLQEGGISFESIGQMAWEALQSAVPAALISILIEKLVAMLVPAAGAVMAIIEGLQAAWGTVSRIIAAFGAFIAFLRAVKGGSAGPLFANLLATAAVVVLDFVANWLLRKLRSAASRVGNRLKGLAERFRNRRRGRRRGRQEGQRGQRRPGRGDNARQDGRSKKQTNEDEKRPTERDKARVARQAAVEAERLDRQDTPARDVKSALERRFKSRYRWIKRFEVSRSLRGVVTIWMIASKKKVTDLGASVAEELDRLIRRINTALESNEDANAKRALQQLLSRADGKRDAIADSPKKVRGEIRELKKEVAQYEIDDEDGAGQGQSLSYRGLDPDKTLNEQLRGSSQLRALKASPNLQMIGGDELGNLTPRALAQMVRDGRISKKVFDGIMKTGEGRDLSHGN